MAPLSGDIVPVIEVIDLGGAEIIEVLVPGPPGPPGAGGGTAYVHNQDSASFVWTINHNLGYKPSVELFDSGSQEFNADVSHPTVNQTVVNLTVPTSGFARLL
jgi:hypothetical protein